MIPSDAAARRKRAIYNMRRDAAAHQRTCGCAGTLGAFSRSSMTLQKFTGNNLMAIVENGISARMSSI
jgi:hypothetical protein